jgi:hypothetical protein
MLVVSGARRIDFIDKQITKGKNSVCDEIVCVWVGGAEARPSSYLA